MGYTVSVKHPHFPEGTEFNVGNLGRVPNGGSLEVDEEGERLFLMSNGRSLTDSFEGDAIVSVSGSSALSQEEVDSIMRFFAGSEVGPEIEVQEQEQEAETPAWMKQDNTEGGEQ